jgi:kynureninase
VVEQEWGERLIRGWNDGWWSLPERVGAKIARLIGAEPNEAIVADSTSVNLYKLALAALRARPERPLLLSDDLNFPSDLYVLASATESAGADRRLEVIASPDGMTLPEAALAEALEQRRGEVALVSLSHTAFKSAFVHDMAAVTALAHDVGAWMLWDLSHSVGAMPLDLRAAGVEMAVGCCYKYLCGGPGAPAFLYIRRELQETLANPIAGWIGGAVPFAFETEYAPAPGLRRFLTGTPPIASLALIEPGVDLLLEAGLERIRTKSVRQTEFLIDLWETLLAPLGFELRSPREEARRGSHVALGHPEGWRINRALVERLGVIPDFRAPDNLRLGVCPLYTTYGELHAAALALRRAVEERLYDEFPVQPTGVT